MNEIQLTKQPLLKQCVYFSLCLLVPYLYFLGYDTLSFYILFTYIGIVFYQAEHFNIRFIIGMVAVEEMLGQISQNVMITFTRAIFQLGDHTLELFLNYFLQGFLALLMCFAILSRGFWIDWFKSKTNTGQTYRLIGMEWFLLLAYLSVVILHFLFIGLTFESMLNVTDFESYMGWYDLENIKNYQDHYDNVYLIICMLQMFALQSYNYKRCRREWYLKS